jgi:hypothetical protein
MGQVPAGIDGERRNVGRRLSASEAQLKVLEHLDDVGD